MDDFDYANYSSFSVFHRLLGPAAATGDDEPDPVDYAVVGVLVITLGLILVIEVLRQQLDAATSGHSFSKVVVELMYRELTTLGVVEFWIYLLHKYWQGFNYNLEAMFVDVHFMLFYTAVFNAIQCGLVRLITSHRTKHTWMETEDIDIGHYVAIRKEFDRVESTIKQTCHFLPKEDVTPSRSTSNRFRFLNEATNDLAFKLRYPHLHRKRKRLLTPIRFHELRAHFIDSNNLPQKFRVSLYLKRCLTSVLVDLVHISPAAWIMLMATANLLYFIMGMILNNTMDVDYVELCLVSVVVGCMIAFVVFAFVLYFQMRLIFSKILHMKLTIFDADLSIDKTFRFTALASFRTQTIDQKNLFWGSNPRIIIVIIQYMQFGYALGLSIFFTFHKQFNTSYSVVDPEYIILGLILSYLVFLYLVTTILPWYTLCTSLGQLVKKDRLNETVAKLKLSEEIRMKESLEEERRVEAEIAQRRKEADAENGKASTTTALSEEKKEINGLLDGFYHRNNDGLDEAMRPKRSRRMRSISDNVALMRSLTSNISEHSLSISEKPVHISEDFNTMKQDGMNQLSNNMFPPSQQSVELGQMHSPESPGLRRMNTMAVFEHPTWLPDASAERPDRIVRRRRMKCQSEGVATMRMSQRNDLGLMLFHDSAIRRRHEKLAALAELTKISAEDLPEIPKFSKSVKPNKASSESKSSEVAQRNNVGAVRNTGLVATIKAATHGIDSLLIPSKNISDEAKANVPLSQGVTFSEHDTETKGDGSVNRTIIDDDDDSDIDDVPEAEPPVAVTVARLGRLKAIAQSSNLAAFFESMQYRSMSLIVGPMQCFFYIARVEIFNIRANIFVDQTSMWHNYQEVFFWLEIATYCIMITEMITVLVVFLSRRGRDGSFFACTAAVFGFLINVMCLFLLLIAEAKRCCDDNNLNTNIFTRILRPSSSTEYDVPVAEYVNCCPHFGKRVFGGLGNIEPYTSLIVLAPMRFIVASFIVKFFGNGTSQADKALQDAEPFDQDHDVDPTIKVRELWMAAIGVHSDVAQKYGLFSGELLQCMLGIYDDEKHDDSAELEISGINNIVSELETIHRDTTPIDTSSSSHAGALASPIICRQQSGNFDWWSDDFAYPKARLIRRMRRCERRLLPLLDEWMVVDVVLTSHELILFEVLDDMEQTGLSREPATSSLNNGGKGSYLCDVAKGRKVVSQFNLDEINCVDIEHRVAIPGENKFDSEDIEGNHNSNLQEYWQRGGHTTHADYDTNAMTKRWDHVDEDRLKIQFKHNHNALLLRFMVDLKEMEDKRKFPQDISTLMNTVGTQTKVWCRTIARLRGATNLRQSLPHFGNDVTEEIEDFIKVRQRDSERNNNLNSSATNLRRSVNRRRSLNQQRDPGNGESPRTNNNILRSIRRNSMNN